MTSTSALRDCQVLATGLKRVHRKTASRDQLRRLWMAGGREAFSLAVLIDFFDERQRLYAQRAVSALKAVIYVVPEVGT